MVHGICLIMLVCGHLSRAMMPWESKHHVHTNSYQWIRDHLPCGYTIQLFDRGMTKEDELTLLRSQPHVPDQPALIPGAPTTFQDSILNSMVDWWFALAVWNTGNKGTVAFTKTDLESNNKPATRKWPWFHGVFSWANLRLCCPQWVHSSQPKACLSWSTKGRTDMGLMGAYRWTLGLWGFPGFPRNSQNDHQMNWGQPNQPMVQSWIPWWGCCNTTWPQKKEFCPALSSSVLDWISTCISHWSTQGRYLPAVCGGLHGDFWLSA